MSDFLEEQKNKINPAFANVIGTESWERVQWFGEIERLTKERDEIKRELNEQAASNARLREVLEKALRVTDAGYSRHVINAMTDEQIDALDATCHRIRTALAETHAQSLAHIEARALRRAAEICEGLYMGTYEGCDEHHYTDGCAEAIEAEAKEIEDGCI